MFVLVSVRGRAAGTVGFIYPQIRKNILENICEALVP